MVDDTAQVTESSNLPSKRLRIGVIGCGGASWMAHLQNTATNPNTELVSVCDIDDKRRQATVEKWKPKTSYTDYEVMLRKEALDAVIIATPNYQHREQGIAASQAGLHVLIEKPLAWTNGEAWDIVRTFHQNSKKLMFGCDRRFSLQSEMAKKLIDDGFVGKLTMTRSTMHELNVPYQENIAATNYRLKSEESGSGTLFDQGSHKVDLLRWFKGKEVKRVIGRARSMLMPAGCPDDVA
jgi:UDP-N-acetylglucosamine 3-dehydrogenase